MCCAPKCLEIDVLCTAICAQRTIQSSCIAFWAIPIEDNYGYEHFIHTKMESSLTCVYAASCKPPLQHKNCVGLQEVSNGSTWYIVLYISEKKVVPNPPLVANRRPKNLNDLLVRATMKPPQQLQEGFNSHAYTAETLRVAVAMATAHHLFLLYPST